MRTRSYDKEFKINAAKLYLEGSRSYKQVGDELGIPESTLAQWVIKHQKGGVEAFPGKGHLKPEDAELARLRKELAVAKEERDILKKALGIFSLPKK
jgi:transposase